MDAQPYVVICVRNKVKVFVIAMGSSAEYQNGS
jgi:hypothetical protein